MNRPAPTPPGATRHKPLTVLTVVAVVLAFAVLAFAPAKPPVTPDEVTGAIEHLTTGAEASALSQRTSVHLPEKP